VKRVPAPGAQIVLTADARGIDAKNLGFTTSPHEECAVEEAIRLVETDGGDVTVLTVGPPEADEQLRYAISVGAHHAVRVGNETIAGGEDPDPQATARAIADAVRGLEADAGVFDVLLFGNESADSAGFQVGVRVARALGRPIVNGIKAIDIADGVLTARR
jgi:electron transfer flavoprotein beta subunit